MIGRDLSSRSMAWRLILDTARGAAENMAVDEAILRSCAEASSPPTLRIYSWKRPSISLGCHQPTRGALDLDYCRKEGIEVVRRITGGRAVIHGTDVTFSIAIRECDLPEGCTSVLASHRWLMGGIVAGLRLLGIEAEIGSRIPQSAIRNPNADCFAHIAECDVRVGQVKSVGSAQVRRFGAILEQGSIPYAPPAFDAARVLGTTPSSNDANPLDGISYATIADAVVRGFRERLESEIEPAGLTQTEADLAADLARGKYATDAWTHSQAERAELSSL